MDIYTIQPMTKLQIEGLSIIQADGYKALIIQDSDAFEGDLMVWLDDEEMCAHICVDGSVDYSY